ncbi:MAG TPA: glycosyltransferase family 4 protein [Chloroflexota bacterium]
MVRSLLLASSFPPAVGGMETLLYQTTRRLAWPPLVIAPRAAAPGSAPPDMDVRWVAPGLLSRATYRPTWYLHPSIFYVASMWQAALRAPRPDVIQVGHIALAPLGWWLARRLRVPWLIYVYGQEVWRAGRRNGLPAVDALLRGRALRAAAAILSPGSFTTGLLQDWGVRTERIVCVPYGAEPQTPISEPSGTSLLSVARLVPRKGIDTVIRALPHLANDVDYRVVGRGPDERRLRDLAQQLGVQQRVHFLGRLDDAALAAEYQHCALFVLPSRRTNDGELEGYGLVHFEAAAWGRPVVAGRSGGEVDAVVDGETGLLVDGASVDAVTRALQTLLAEPDRLRRMGDAGRRRVETTHNWQRAAAVVDQVLDRLH